MDDPQMQERMEAVEDAIARVLREAHQEADELNKPNEARAILHLAQRFADELAPMHPRFDRAAFIRAATEPAGAAGAQGAAGL